MSFEEQIVSRFGPLLTIEQLAELLHRPAKSLSVSLGRPGPLSDKLNTARVKIGRKVYFRASDLAAALS
ncbi:DNA-binding protein [Pseudomonas aeruginosa]|uniref:DNA-binding protein n=1 Tax=Pseudomonas aeruginosa TaxID=287 RepID=UPI0011B3675E|nr:DNA-binding protein [Pseudomonas aeruginosa]MCV0133340.1 DNA-binding protein [Pseudomonas aeruginosa]TWW52334.1 DNA-binding protein [Pseudomonas aeruginosa]HCF2284633.1 DNA-binding protein [Pseudomonas aeruginosa]